MSLFSKASILAIAAAFTIVGPTALASPGGVGGATEATQILNNVQLGTQTLKQIRSMEELITSTVYHVKNWKQLLLTNLPLGQGDVMATLGDLNREINNFQNYQSSLQRAGSSLQQLNQVFDARTVQASLRGVTFQDYLNIEARRVSDGDLQARQRLETERRIVEAANQDLQSAVANSGQFDNAKGPTEAIGMLNTQVNQLVQQNARTAIIMANATGTEQALAKKKESEAAARTADTATRMKEAEAAKASEIQSAIDGMSFR